MTCPRCGSDDVREYDSGRKDCVSCPWEFRPDRQATQSGLADY